MKYVIVAILFSFGTFSEAYAKCATPDLNEKYIQLEILECVSSEHFLNESKKLKNYTDKNLKAVKSSASELSIVNAIPLANVEIIDSKFKDQHKKYIGRVEYIKSRNVEQFQFLHVPYQECKSNLEGKKGLFRVYKNFQCCRDMMPINFQETIAHCLTQLPQTSIIDIDLNDKNQYYKSVTKNP